MQLEPLGDQAVMAYCSNERHATQLAERVRRNRPDWCIDIVQAYLSVAVYYDILAIDYFHAADWIAQFDQVVADESSVPVRTHVIPCCYDFGLDFDSITEHTGLSRSEIIAQHSSATYTVYAIGFCPGFPYLGYLPETLAGVPRLASPRLRVEAGSVGLTGRQTGIYTEPRPGGWNIVGLTPLELVNVKDEYFPLQTGDLIQFRPITQREFKKLAGSRFRRLRLGARNVLPER